MGCSFISTQGWMGGRLVTDGGVKTNYYYVGRGGRWLYL